MKSVRSRTVVLVSALVLVLVVVALRHRDAARPDADRFVAPGGSDAGSCTAEDPCAGLARAYAVADPGDEVEVAEGVYPAQVIVARREAAGGPPVTIRAAREARVVLRGLQLGSGPTAGDGPQDLVLDGFRLEGRDGRERPALAFAGSTRIRWQDIDAANFYLNGVRRFTIAGGDWGPCRTTNDETADACSNSKLDANASLPNEDVLIDGARFHDYRIVPGSGAHFECLFIMGGRRIVVRNSSFTGCAFYDIFVAPRNGDSIERLTIEGNVLAAPWDDQATPPTNRRPSALAFSHGGQPAQPWRDVLVRFNTFDPGTGIGFNEDGGAFTSSGNRVVGNIMRLTACDPRFETAYNVIDGPACSGTDRSLPGGAPERAAAAARGLVRLEGGGRRDAGAPRGR